MINKTLCINNFNFCVCVQDYSYFHMSISHFVACILASINVQVTPQQKHNSILQQYSIML